eukprot:gene10206-11101_t
MNTLPDVIYHEILLYIADVDHISLSMIDKSRCNLLLKRVRKIQINEKKAQLFFTSQEFRDKIKSLIVDPYHQLSLMLCNIEIPKDFEAFSCNSITGLEQLSDSLIPYLQRVQRLEIYCGFSPQSRDHDYLSKLIGWINSNPSLSLKILKFSFYRLTDFRWMISH